MFELKKRNTELTSPISEHADRQKNINFIELTRQMNGKQPFTVHIHQHHATICLQRDFTAPKAPNCLPMSVNTDHNTFKKVYNDICSTYWKIYHEHPEFYTHNMSIREGMI